MSSLGPWLNSAHLSLDRRTVPTPGAPLGIPGKGPTYPGRVGPRHPHHGRGGIEKTGAHLEHLGLATTPLGQEVPMYSAISSRTERPFMATVAPLGDTSGIDHPSRRWERRHAR